RPDPTTEMILFRVAQEAISNVINHSGATRVEIALHAWPRGALLSIEDDGTGFDPKPPEQLLQDRHLGLRGMQERVQMAGGRWQIDSEPGKGTKLVAFIPAG